MDCNNGRPNSLPDTFPTAGMMYFTCGPQFLSCPRCGRIPSRAFRNDAPNRPYRAEWWSAMLKCNCGSSLDAIAQCWFVCRFCEFGQKERKFGRVMTTQKHLKAHHTKYKCHQELMELIQKEDLAITPALSHAESPGCQLTFEQPHDDRGSTNSSCAGSAVRRLDNRLHADDQDIYDDDADSFTFDAYDNDESEEDARMDDDGNNDGARANTMDYKQWLHGVKASAVHIPTHFVDCFPDKRATIYFQRHSTDRFGGAATIVSRAFYSGTEYNRWIHPLTSLHALLYARLSTQVSVKVYEEISYLLDYWINPPASAVSDGYQHPPIPRSPKDIRDIFLSNQHAIMKNLPFPKVETVDGHSYVSPIGCMRDFMGHGHHVSPLFPGNSAYSRSARGAELTGLWRQKENAGSQMPYSFPIGMILWQDDMDPANAKGNRHNVWVCLLTFTASDSRIHKRSNTYLISLGRGDQSHAEVERRMQEDLQTLSKGIRCYYGAWQSPVKCYGLIYAKLADRPAKAKGTWTIAGNAATHHCFGVCGLTPTNLSSCAQCHKKRMDRETEGTCVDCLDWNLIGAKYVRPQNYPPTIYPDMDMLEVKQITFGTMTAACNTLYRAVLRNEITTTAVARVYMKHEGLTEALSDSIFENAKNSDEEISILDTNLHPPSWKEPHVDIDTWTHVVMHMIFLGLVKSVFGEFIKLWFKAHRKYSVFFKICNRRIGKIQHLKLIWLKIQPLSSSDGSFGRYVSENYMAYVRLSKWLYADLDRTLTNQDQDSVYEDPVGKEDVAMFTKKELRGWLHARGIPYLSKLAKSALLELAQCAIASNGGNWPEKRVDQAENVYRQKTPMEAVQLICSLLALVSRVMIRGDISDSQADDTHRHVKLFLTTTVNWAGMKGVLSKYNFLYLLTLADTQRKYGSFRNLWEGGPMGEGGLPPIKKAIKSLKGDKWYVAAHERVLRERALENIMHTVVDEIKESKELKSDIKEHYLVKKAATDLYSFEDDGDNEEGDEIGHDNDEGGRYAAHFGQNPSEKSFQVYKQAEVFEKFFNASHGVSAVQLSDDSYCIVVAKKSDGMSKFARLLPIQPKVQNAMKSSGACYLLWTLVGVDDEESWWDQWKAADDGSKLTLEDSCLLSTATGQRTVKRHLMLLPWNGSLVDHERKQYYYCISSGWEEMVEDGSIVQPRFLA